nr:aminomethyltransferase family protein [uncultured Dongia sp.]
MTVMERSQSRPRVIEPGLPRWDPAVERYRLAGQGALILRLESGDHLEITDREGRQACEIAAFTGPGAQHHETPRPDLGALGLKGDGPSAGITQILAGRPLAHGNPDEIIQLRHQLAQWHMPKGVDDAARVLTGDTRPGDTAKMQAERPVIVVLHAPGSEMLPEDQMPPTDLSVVVRRANPSPLLMPPLPAPLGEMVAEYRVDKCTALSYEVRQGQFIQIIDVAGRQCSDFVAFDARQLAAGRERGIDMTTTRTMLGAIYPGPGLASKFFDVDMQALVEVVRDTCGRHDTFGLACTPRFYEDAGYPGHPSCSENFNFALEKFGLETRRGWQAVNLFYNTGVNAANAIFLDDPWSRPGDYVLMKAMKDLVCGSSACPDDIDATNAWNPTDIHVRIYDAKNSFSRAMAYRMTPESEPILTRETGFHPRTSALTRNFTEYRGFWLPNRFNNAGPTAEYWAAREAAVVMDLSPLRKFEVLGADAEDLLQIACTRNIRKLSDGQVVYTAMCYEHGGMVDDGTVFRLGQDRYRWIGGDEFGGKWLRDLAEKRGLKQVWVKSATDQLHNIAVQGPKSRDILKEIIWTPPARSRVDEIQWFNFTVGRIGDYNGVAVVVSRTGYSGELGYEIFCHPKDAPAVWDAVWAAGQPHGLLPLGLEALDILRIEAGLVFANYEFNDQTDPYEAGIGFTVALKGNEEFVGREAIIRRKEHAQRVLVGLEIDAKQAVGHGDCVHVGRAQVGVVTSGCISPGLGKNIALCRIDVTYAALGTEVEIGKIDGQQKRLPARVVKFPFYDPEKLKPRS